MSALRPNSCRRDSEVVGSLGSAIGDKEVVSGEIRISWVNNARNGLKRGVKW